MRRNSKKPPIGLKPSIFVDEARIKDILEAMKRFSKCGRPVPEIWIDEMESRIAMLKNYPFQRCLNGTE